VCVRPRGVNVGVLECGMRLLFPSACPNGEVSIQSPKSAARAHRFSCLFCPGTLRPHTCQWFAKKHPLHTP
jgi:hypothetical protein